MCKYFLFKDHIERSEPGWLSTHTQESVDAQGP